MFGQTEKAVWILLQTNGGKTMKKVIRILCLVLLMICIAAVASAADKFAFESRNLTVFEGDSMNLSSMLVEDGIYAGGGSYTWKSSRPQAVEIASDGTITALNRGTVTITCTITTDNGKKRNATLEVKVARRVTSVALKKNKNLNIFEPTDGSVAEIMQESTDYPVIVLPLGKQIELAAEAEPSDATDRAVQYSTSDPSIAVIQNSRAIKGTKAGECDLTVYSRQNPEVVDMYHLLVVQPITKIKITGAQKVNVGSTLQLDVGYEPANASFQAVKWTCSPEAMATVDEYGLLTGLKKGNATVTATAADGSGKTATYRVTVEQPPESVTVKNDNVIVNVGRTAQLSATVNPNTANNRKVVWTSSDPSVATVANNGTLKGIAVGECQICCAAEADESVFAIINVQVQQPVTKITFTESKMNVYVGEGGNVSWIVEPSTATNPTVTLKSSNEKIATVDQNGYVTGLKRGTTKITATSTDGSKKVGSITVRVIQPVEGVYFRQDIYHVPLRGSLNLHSYTIPEDADIQAMTWVTDDPYVAVPRSSHTEKNSVALKGEHLGSTTLYCTTDDGGFTAQALAVVDHFEDPVVITDLYLNGGNDIKIRFQNQTNMNLTNVYFTMELYDQAGYPLPCMNDGSNVFQGYTLDPLAPGDYTQHGRFRFKWDYMPAQQIGGMILKVTNYNTDDPFTNDGKQVTFSRKITFEELRPVMSYPVNFQPTPVDPIAPAPGV